ncbi:uncharacterized protein MELLADRAFT_71555 [Melampsora larici-populina 98AG31]|uniref:Uncharacterized protein n=1 Tax=Melampsora larici-populina (strain 98AG31 / pathotype 3-4-7) TaxID=747676 RepID=F4R651_MELLP|nr:uncharacterized protein MELLADRAFT_70581 [Melampsora larici-populina 98AG31]XP_007408833.1 uncharacterized protein MELLADRAFT_71555 [Melampsora larici-populina 98AG31]EGG08068.1 hypothetical protein MELLADRAFT_71555 [Melampsora larici-populina 98AG31]EGG11824.1 hypothetical protein MELLADRAFT_70581 [Melampsora larici-populina 98AG31]
MGSSSHVKLMEIQRNDLLQLIKLNALEFKIKKLKNQRSIDKLIIKDLRLSLKEAEDLNKKSNLDSNEGQMDLEVLKLKSLCKNQENQIRLKDEIIFELNQKIQR